MDDVTMGELFARIEGHFRDADYRKALDCAVSGTQRFPDQFPGFTYFRLCALARLEKQAQLAQVMNDALAQGVWYSEFLLRESPSFEPLQGDATFEALVRANARLQAEQLASGEGSSPLTLVPEHGAEPYPVFVVLHGNTSTTQAEVDAWRSVVDRGWILAMAESTQGHWAGQYSWDDYEISRRDVLAYYRTLCDDYPLDLDRLVLGGFSLGGQVALRLALEGAIPARGFLLNAPFVPETDPWEERVAAASGRDLRGYFVANEQDVTCTPESIRAVANLCEAQGIPCRVQMLSEPGHDYPGDFATYLAQGLDFVVGNE